MEAAFRYASLESDLSHPRGPPLSPRTPQAGLHHSHVSAEVLTTHGSRRSPYPPRTIQWDERLLGPSLPCVSIRGPGRLALGTSGRPSALEAPIAPGEMGLQYAR